MKIKVVEYVKICGTLTLNYMLMMSLPLAHDISFSEVSWTLFSYTTLVSCSFVTVMKTVAQYSFGHFTWTAKLALHDLFKTLLLSLYYSYKVFFNVYCVLSVYSLCCIRKKEYMWPHLYVCSMYIITAFEVEVCTN